MANRSSIRFFEDKEVRAIWNDEKSRWRFSVLDFICVTECERLSWQDFKVGVIG
jgi:cell filamentation protein